MWDTSIIYHEDKYYLFSMYKLEGKNTYAWCAVSDDGVHYNDVGTIIQDTDFFVLKMFVHKFGDKYIMNHGIFSDWDGKPLNDTLCFWESNDLINWSYLGKEKDSHPDERWYNRKGRWDHMYTIDCEDGYYGYCVATTSDDIPYSSCGLMYSKNGVDWEVLPPPVIEWGDIPPVEFEVGGCEKIGDMYYLIGGAGLHMGNWNYSVFTFVADNPRGPFTPLKEAYRLCGSNKSGSRMGVQWLASFGRGKDDEILITNYITAQFSDEFNFIGTKENVWLLPVKKAILDQNGGLHMGYWKQNDLLKGQTVNIDKADFSIASSCTNSPGQIKALNGNANITIGPDNAPFKGNFLDKGQSYVVREDYTVAFYDKKFDIDKGIVVEGYITVNGKQKLCPVKAGFCFGQKEGAIAILCEAGDKLYRKTDIVEMYFGEKFSCKIIDETGAYCATVNGLDMDVKTPFRLFYRKNMFELYLKDMLVQSFIVPSESNGQLGFAVQNAEAIIESIKIYKMNL